MDEADIAENCLISSPGELAKLGVKELLTTSAPMQSENNQGKQTANAKKEIEGGLRCLQILKTSLPANTCVNTLNKKSALNKGCIQSATKESMNLPQLVPSVEAKQGIDTNKEQEISGSNDNIFLNIHESVNTREQQNTSEHVADSVSPTESPSKSIKILSNTKVHIPTDDLKEMISRFGKFKTNQSFSGAAEDNNQGTSERSGREYVPSHLDQQTVPTKVGNQSCKRDLDLMTNLDDKSFHMTVNYNEISFSIREMKLENRVSEDFVQVNGKQGISEAIKNEKQKAVRRNLQNVLGTDYASYNLKNVQEFVSDSDTQDRSDITKKVDLDIFPTENMVQSGNVENVDFRVIRENPTKHLENRHCTSNDVKYPSPEKSPLIDVQNNIKLNLKNILVTGDPFYMYKGKTLDRRLEAVSPKCEKNRRILLLQSNEEVDGSFDKDLFKGSYNIRTDITEVLENTRNTNIASNLCGSSGNNKMSVCTSSSNEAETDIFEEYLSKINSNSEGMEDNRSNFSLMKNESVEPVSTFCNIEDDSEDENNIFEEYMSMDMRNSCVDAEEYCEQHTITSPEYYHPNEQKNVADQLPKNGSVNNISDIPVVYMSKNMKNSCVNAEEYSEQHTITGTELNLGSINNHPNEQKNVADQLPENNSGNVTINNTLNIMSDNSSYNLAVNSGCNQLSDGNEKIVQDEDAQNADTDCIDYKESTEDVSLLLCLNGDGPILPETPCPDIKKFSIYKVDSKTKNTHSVVKTREKNLKIFRRKGNSITSFKRRKKSKRNLRNTHSTNTSYVIKFREDLNPSNIVVEASSNIEDSIASHSNGDEIKVDNVVLRFYSNDVISSSNGAKIETDPILLQQTSHGSNITDLVTASESSKNINSIRDNSSLLIPQEAHLIKCHDNNNASAQEESLHSDSLLPEKLRNVNKDISSEDLKNTDLCNSTKSGDLKRNKKTALNMPLENPKNLDSCNQKGEVDTTNILDGMKIRESENSEPNTPRCLRKRFKNPESLDTCNQKGGVDTTNIPYVQQKNLNFVSRKRNKPLKDHQNLDTCNEKGLVDSTNIGQNNPNCKGQKIKISNEKFTDPLNSCNSESENYQNTPRCLRIRVRNHKNLDTCNQKGEVDTTNIPDGSQKNLNCKGQKIKLSNEKIADVLRSCNSEPENSPNTSRCLRKRVKNLKNIDTCNQEGVVDSTNIGQNNLNCKGQKIKFSDEIFADALSSCNSESENDQNTPRCLRKRVRNPKNLDTCNQKGEVDTTNIPDGSQKNLNCKGQKIKLPNEKIADVLSSCNSESENSPNTSRCLRKRVKNLKNIDTCNQKGEVDITNIPDGGQKNLNCKGQKIKCSNEKIADVLSSYNSESENDQITPRCLRKRVRNSKNLDTCNQKGEVDTTNIPDGSQKNLNCKGQRIKLPNKKIADVLSSCNSESENSPNTSRCLRKRVKNLKNIDTCKQKVVVDTTNIPDGGQKNLNRKDLTKVSNDKNSDILGSCNAESENTPNTPRCLRKRFKNPQNLDTCNQKGVIDTTNISDGDQKNLKCKGRTRKVSNENIADIWGSCNSESENSPNTPRCLRKRFKNTQNLDSCNQKGVIDTSNISDGDQKNLNRKSRTKVSNENIADILSSCNSESESSPNTPRCLRKRFKNPQNLDICNQKGMTDTTNIPDGDHKNLKCKGRTRKVSNENIADIWGSCNSESENSPNTPRCLRKRFKNTQNLDSCNQKGVIDTTNIPDGDQKNLNLKGRTKVSYEKIADILSSCNSESESSPNTPRCLRKRFKKPKDLDTCNQKGVTDTINISDGGQKNLNCKGRKRKSSNEKIGHILSSCNSESENDQNTTRCLRKRVKNPKNLDTCNQKGAVDTTNNIPDGCQKNLNCNGSPRELANEKIADILSSCNSESENSSNTPRCLRKRVKNIRNLDTCDPKVVVHTIDIPDDGQKNLDCMGRSRKLSNEKITDILSSCNCESENSPNTPRCLPNNSLEALVQKSQATKQINADKLENNPNIPGISRITGETVCTRKHISKDISAVKHSRKCDNLNGDDMVKTVESSGHTQVKQSRRTRKSEMPSSVNGFSCTSRTGQSGNSDSEFEDPSIHSLSSTPVKQKGRPKKLHTSSHSDENYSITQETGTKRRRRSKNDSHASKRRKVDICDEEGESIANRNISSEEDVILKSENPFHDSVNKHNEQDSKKGKNSLGVDETINYPPRKRGRPRKSAVETIANDSSETKPDLLTGVSKRGRKITRLNYSTIGCEGVTNSKNDANNVKEENLILRTEDAKNENCDGDVSNNLDSSNLNSKYKWTGITTMAVNQIFKVLQGKDVQEVSHDAESGLIKRKRGRTKNQDHLLDESGTSVCMVCKETIANPNWIQHKREVHYNLTWRKGESPLDISDSAVVLKKYKELHNEQKYLKCNKCGKKVKKVKAFVDHLEICNGVINDTGLVVCAVCKKEMGKNEWQYHKYREHNNLAWREGDPPLNLQDQDLVFRILTQLYKAKKPLHCETCKQQKKSVMGYLSHKSVCKLSQLEVENVKVACKICEKKVLPVSMESHMKIHNKPEPNMSKESEYFEINLDSTGPRKAAEHALKVIKSIKGELGSGSSKYYVEQCDFDDDFVVTVMKKKAAQCPDLSCLFSDCDFKTPSIDFMINHLKYCEKKPEQYIICKLCLSWFTEESEIKDHIKSVHNKIVAGDTDVDLKSEVVECTSDDDIFIEEVEMEKKRLRLKGKLTLMNNASQKVKPIFLIHPMREQSTLVYAQAFPWMINFCEKNYSIPNLFEDFRNCDPWQVLDCDILDDYLPRQHESCDITVKALTHNDIFGDKDLEYRKLELFEVCNFYKGEATIYCGGPVTTLAWMPTPYNQEDQNQVLAVAVVNQADKEYSVSETYNEPYVIQFWSFGKLNWRQEYDIKPSLLFGLALPSGPVWHLEWCPSGCSDSLAGSNHSRLGLLAVATSDSFVYIYSIDDIREEDDRGLIYRGKPVAKLQIDAETNSIGKAYYATRISWTKAKEHRYIAVGYSTGMIALFDLLSTSPLFRRADQSGTRIFFPYQTFQGHVSCITGLTLGHFNGGNRWCFSTGMDRAVIFWDLSNITKVTFHRKQGIAEGLWLTQWPVNLLAEEESTFNETLLAHSFTKPVRDFMTQESINFTYSQSGIKSISFSDWLNLILHGGNAGEVTGQFAHRMFFNVEKKQFKKGYTKCIFSVAKLINRDHFNDHPLKNVTYEGVCSNYGIVFVDYNSNNFSEIPNTKTNNIKGLEGDKYNIHDYPLKAITKVAANPNQQACTFYATGYQAGFLRVRGMEFLESHLNPRDFTGYDFSESL